MLTPPRDPHANADLDNIPDGPADHWMRTAQEILMPEFYPAIPTEPCPAVDLSAHPVATWRKFCSYSVAIPAVMQSAYDALDPDDTAACDDFSDALEIHYKVANPWLIIPAKAKDFYLAELPAKGAGLPKPKCVKD